MFLSNGQRPLLSVNCGLFRGFKGLRVLVNWVTSESRRFLTQGLTFQRYQVPRRDLCDGRTGRHCPVFRLNFLRRFLVGDFFVLNLSCSELRNRKPVLLGKGVSVWKSRCREWTHLPNVHLLFVFQSLSLHYGLWGGSWGDHGRARSRLTL